MKTLFHSFVKIGLAFGLCSLIIATPALALGETGAQGGVNAARGAGVPGNLVGDESSIVRQIVNIMLYVIGVLSVIMLIYGGLRYVVSGGQKEAVTNAKNTILYALIGLLIALFAWAMVKFVLDAALGFSGGTDV
ncbi:MAG: pilin [Candidatus Saccharibacteria bacterium]|nr:pilin [Candidatus Saccharibacteria bacterium]